jgi:hypothetical protein
MTRTSKHLFTAALLLVLLPHALPQSLWIGSTIFGLNLAVSLWGAIRGEFRPAWITYAVACIASFVLFGMTDPVNLFLVLILFALPGI